MTKTIIIARETEENVWCASTSIKRIADFMNVSTTTVYRFLNNTDYYRGKKYEIKTGVELLTMKRGNVSNMKNRDTEKMQNNNIERKADIITGVITDATILLTDKDRMNNITEDKGYLSTDTANAINTDTTDTFDLF